MIGVGYDLFWELNPVTLQPFIKAFDLKQTSQDNLLWIQGQYIQIAIASVLSKDVKYPSRPFMKEVKISKSDDIKSKFLHRMNELNARFEKEE